MVKNIKAIDVIKDLKKVAVSKNAKVNQKLLNLLNNIPDSEEFVFQANDELRFDKLVLMNDIGYSDSVMVDYFLKGLEVANNKECLLYQVLSKFIDYSSENSKEQ